MAKKTTAKKAVKRVGDADGMLPGKTREQRMKELTPVELTDEQAAAMAELERLHLDHFIELTGVSPGRDSEWDLYRVSSEGVEFVGYDSGSLGKELFPAEMERLSRLPSLTFPCSPAELVAFVDHPQTLGGHFTLPARFRAAVAIDGQHGPIGGEPGAEQSTQRRSDALAFEIEEAINELGGGNPDANAVMKALKERASVGREDERTIVSTFPGGLMWRRSKDGPLEELDFPKLRKRLRRRKERTPSGFP